MLAFYLYTILFLIGTACFAKVLHFAIQPGQILSGWQHVLTRLHDANSRFLNGLAKPLGDCDMCFSWAISVLSFFAYLLVVRGAIGVWITTPLHSMILAGLTNVTWFLLYAAIGCILSLFTITRLFR